MALLAEGYSRYNLQENSHILKPTFAQISLFLHEDFSGAWLQLKSLHCFIIHFENQKSRHLKQKHLGFFQAKTLQPDFHRRGLQCC